MNVALTGQAIADLKKLRDFIDKKAPESAKKISGHLIRQLKALGEFPKLGVLVEGKFEAFKIRDLIIENYRIRYFVHKKKVVVLRIWHTKEEGGATI